MAKATKKIPEGRHTLTPTLTVKGAVHAIEFYKKAFGAQELMRMPSPDGKMIMHAELKIGDSIFFISDEFPEMRVLSPESLGGSSSSLFIATEDTDALYNQAIAAGAKSKMPPADMFWGDRFASVTDPFGHVWSLATHIEDLTVDEIKERQKEFFSQMAAQKN